MQVKVMTATRTAGVEITAEDTSEVVNVFTTTPNIYILAMYARVKTAFAGVTAPVVKLGTPTTTDFYIESQSIGRVGDLRTRIEPAYRTALVHPVGCHSTISHQGTPANIPIVATFESSSGNLSDLTAGEIEFVMVYAE